MKETNWIIEIDWSGIGAMLQGIGTVIGAIAVIVAAKVGSSTFQGWREQKLSERKIEQAERILTAAYKVRRGLSYVRSPMMLPHEIATAEDNIKESGQWENASESEQQRLSTTQAYYNRLNATKDDRVALEECQPMARALFGEDLEVAIETLNRQYHLVQVYVDANHRDRGDSETTLRDKINAIIYEGHAKEGGKNQMDQTIAEQVKLIESICVPVLRLEGSAGK